MTPELAKQIAEARERAEAEQAEVKEVMCPTCWSQPGFVKKAPEEIPTGTIRISNRNTLEHVCHCRAWVGVQMYKFYTELGFEYGETDNKKVTELVQRMRKGGTPQAICDFVRDDLRQMTYQSRQLQQQFDWEQDLPGDVVDWAKHFFTDFDDPCKDNYRVARSDSRRQMRQYRKQQKHGCCGRYDREFDVCGAKYMIGLNYGH